jgi:hypothetical protein
MTFGYSRDDAGSFLPEYVDKKILPKDPFESIDTVGVGQLVQMGTERGRSANAKLKVGVCGEHGGDPDSIRFFRSCNLNTCRARRTACRWQGSRRRRRSWNRRRTRGSAGVPPAGSRAPRPRGTAT